MRRSLLAALALIVVLFAPLSARAAGAAVLKGGNHEVEEFRNLAYYEGADADPVRHRLDLYVPKGRKDFPVLFFVHGGYWRSGNKNLYAPLGRVFARNGIGTVIINYRLSPQVK